MRQTLTSASSIIVFALMLAQPALAGRLDIEPSVSVAVRYSDNPTLIPDESDPDSALSTIADVNFVVQQQAPDTSLVFNPKFRRIEYFDSKFDKADGNEYFLDGEIIKSRELFSFGSNFRFANQTVLTAEDSDANDPNPDASANFLQVEDRVERLTVAPFLNLNLTEIDFLTVTGQLARVDQIKRLSPRADYNVRFLSIAYQRAMDERNFVGLETTASRTDSVSKFEYCTFFSIGPTVRDTCLGLTDMDGNPSEKYIVTQTDEQDFESYSASLTYEYKASENLNLKASFGRQKTKINQLITEFRSLEGMKFANRNKSDFDSSTYLFTATYTQPKTNWLFELDRIVQPTSSGDPTDKIEARGYITHRITQLWTANVSALYYRQTQRSATTSSKNNYLKAELNLIRRLSERLSVGATYVYRNRDPQLNAVVPITVANANLNRISHTVTLATRYRF